MRSTGRTTTDSGLLPRRPRSGARGRETLGTGQLTRAHGLTSCRQSAEEQLRVRGTVRLTRGLKAIPGAVAGRQPPLREISEEAYAEAGHGPLGSASPEALSSAVLGRAVRLRKCQAGAALPFTWCRTRLIRRTRGEALRQLLIPTPTPVGAQAALRTGALTHIVEAVVHQVGEAAEEEMALGAVMPDSVDSVAKEKERKEEDGEGGRMATPQVVTIGQRTMMRTTTNSPTVAEVVVVLVRETPCWRFSRG